MNGARDVTLFSLQIKTLSIIRLSVLVFVGETGVLCSVAPEILFFWRRRRGLFVCGFLTRLAGKGSAKRELP